MKTRTVLFCALVALAGMAHGAERQPAAVPIESDPKEQITQASFHSGSAVMAGPKVQVIGAIVPILMVELHPERMVQVKPVQKVPAIIMVGNINSDLLNRIDAADVVFLINFLFHKGKAPASLSAADLDGNGVVDLVDLKILQERLYGPMHEKTPVTTEMK